ncbi:ATP-binding protein [Mesorhizobium sp. M0276]|uniref:ATP-binding protein n=1 Tax=Mesorhizobium sp. M0276 TaxID=2956928 RepID=UPI0033356CFD
MTAVLGEEPEGELDQVDCSLLTLSDLAIAIRPGVSVTSAWAVLAHIAGERRKSAEAGEGSNGSDGPASSSSSKTHASNATTKTGRGKDQGSGSEIIQPAKLTGGEQDRFIPRVETLTGYGEARDWSLSLQADLALWREGRLVWEEMTTKLLLAGPPGTGKTSFARALCNTLQIPLIVTSVATWLEPAYLGDVLRRMKAAFTEAEANKPAILFVDEIDGIGKRGNASRSHDEYWTSFINQALTLLDGASKSSGVIIVGATNNPDAIDPALLRSGRLEKHIVIPRPDTEALIGILRHHLRADLAAVVASAPTQVSAHAIAASISEPEGESGQASIASEGRATGLKTGPVVADPVDVEAPATSLHVTARQARANKQSRRDA